ncbi:isopenicillin N synthase family oxygenase [Pseudooceanicola sp. CBS1P-1]|uniref:2-oxoglutarate-dependent ethylene/succinate-forming enzyme n=1 Tax=Pseudooceanicola albus TaxID=2692189 RepID=A0A6L7G7M3_9RHOB|nr:MULTISPECIES: isopenicillin N synthase family oxygenase [Pseudooceanicola]MBT9383132.1 isopenicillin N synthase family oxygenase [Pseudooceanicola endophyticus]MXN19320.1 isopenicillin N synthase family oxygenase [Pseudooceanicola albus]
MSADFPVLDLAAFAAGDPATRARIGAEVDRTCRETGFLAVGNHGVSEQVIADLWACLTAFFDQPQPAKEALRPGPGQPYGYLGTGTEALAKSRGEDTPPDLKESFNGGPLRTPEGEADPQALAFCYAPTPWPDTPGFRAAWSAYYTAMEDLAARIMQVMAVALHLPEDHFAPFIDAPVSALRALNYPAQARAPEVGQQRAGAHTDYGSLTILLPEPGSRGLEILTPEGTWRAVPPVEGAFVINIGDLMTLWTGGAWVSTLHRVVVPPEAATRRRMSLAFFHQPNWHARITPLSGGEAAAVTSGPYLMAKFSAANS